MNLDASKQSKTLIETILSKKGDIGKCQKHFIVGILLLFLSMRGRHHFKGMARYGIFTEKTYRSNFEKYGEEFDFEWFNGELVKEYLSNDSKQLLIVFDPSYLPESGKQTPGVSYRWSGCLGKAAWGLEIGGIGIVDIEQNTGFHYEAVLTPSDKVLKQEGKTLLDHYASVLIKRYPKLKSYSKYLGVDGYFSKRSFVDTIKTQTGFELICKLRKDAQLKYLYQEPKRKGRGRPKKYDGDVDLNKLNEKYFKTVYENEEVLIDEATVWAVALKRKIKLAYVRYKKENGELSNRYALLFSTDLELSAVEIYQFYKSRFQIEFLFRDAKQHTGLTHCQARSENKLYFHYNIALTAVNIAKAAHWIKNKDINKEEQEKRTPFSLASIKTLYFNELMLDLFFSTFGICPNSQINQIRYTKLLTFGCLAA